MMGLKFWFGMFNISVFVIGAFLIINFIFLAIECLLAYYELFFTIVI